MTQYKILSLYALTPLHVGSGKEVGVVDLPIQRERISNHPICYASGIKGALRQYYGDKKKELIIFGPKPRDDEEESHAGCVSFTDARMIAFPLRSLKRGFVWITCPMILSRFQRDLKMAGIELSWEDPSFGSNNALVSKVNATANPLLKNGKITLEDYVLSASENEALGKLSQQISYFFPSSAGDAFRKKILQDLVLVEDSLFCEFVSFCTEVVARVCLNDEKTVEAGPWYEENLPAESLLYSLLVIKKPMGKTKKNGKDEEPALKTAAQVTQEFVIGSDKFASVLQLGGNETVGRGIIGVDFFDSESWKTLIQKDTNTEEDKEKKTKGGAA